MSVENTKFVCKCRKHCRQCERARDTTGWSERDNTCQGSLLVDQCQGAGGHCVTTQEGFYTMSGVWLAIGALWFVWIFRAVRQLQTIEPGDWRVLNRQESREAREVAGDDRGEKFKYFYFSVRNDEGKETNKAEL